MQRAVPFSIALFSLVFAFGCGSTPAPNSPAANAAESNVNAVNTSASPSMPAATNAAIPPPVNQTVNSSANGGPQVRTLKPGEKIPGIPDAATIKKEINTPADLSKLPPEFRRALNSANSNVANKSVPMMKSKPPMNANINSGPPMMMKKKPSNQ